MAGAPGAPLLATTRSGKVALLDLTTGATTWSTAALGDAIGTSAVTQTYSGADASYQALYSGDLVIVGTKNASATNNKVYGLDAATGAVRWTFNASGATAMDVIVSAPFVDEGRDQVWIATKANGGTQPSLWLLSTLNGTLVQAWSLGDVVGTITYGSEGVLYVPTASGQLYAYDPATQAMRWAAPYDLGANNPVVDYVWEDFSQPQVLFLSTTSGHVWALQSSGTSTAPTLKWKTVVAGASAPWANGATGVLYMGSSDGKVHELRLTDGVDQKQGTLGRGAAAGGVPLWDWSSGWLMAPAASGKVFALPTPLP
ncbi:MAG: PQQ-binding-like beta-propeller repeat protein [Candidatus Rokubacteria bacterium]|nr:PQQ-binding-like beta-propeller repeat protein [Candidatus Rokubacteria bacterium]